MLLKVSPHNSLTFDLGYELASSSEDLHRVKQRIGVDDLTQHPQDLPQTLVSHRPLTLLAWTSHIGKNKPENIHI